MPIKSKEKAFSRFKDFILDAVQPSMRDVILSMNRFHFFSGKVKYDRPLLVQLVDGRDYQGGLTDRLKGIVSASCVAQLLNRQFKIKHTSPFELLDYLEPNKIDWSIKDNKTISSNIFQARLYHLTEYDKGDIIKRIDSIGDILQMHCYCKGELYKVLRKRDGTPFEWGVEFNRLFKPNPILQQNINNCKQIIGGEYIAAVFRFQNLLGDFEEYFYKETDSNTQKEMVNACNQSLSDLQIRFPEKKILVTADSILFLEQLKNRRNIFVFPKKIVHMDWISNAGYESYLKSFLDFYLIAGASMVFSISTEEMYKSDFPKYAAMVNNVPFERISI